MSVKIKKKEEVVGDRVDLSKLDSLTIEQVADLYGKLNDESEAAMRNPVFKQFDVVKKELQSRLEEFEPTDVLDITGEQWVLSVGVAAKSPATIKDIKALFGFLGEATFMKIAKVSITDVNKYCTPDQVAKVLKTDNGYTSRRAIKAKFIGK